MSANPPPLQFIDTNILVYAYDLSAGDKRETAKNIVADCWNNKNGCLSIQVLQEFYVTTTQKLTLPLSRLTARQMISDLSTWKIYQPKADDVLKAIDLQIEYTISFWDAIILQSALRLGCEQVWSEDLSHGQTYQTLTVTNPFQG